MNPNQFQQLIQRKAKQLKECIENQLPKMVGNTTKSFIEGNFRAQGWQGEGFSPWKPNQRKGRILVKSGNLRNSTSYITSPNTVTLYNNVPYAKIHNQGGKIQKIATVTAHTRRAHTRKDKTKGRIAVPSSTVKTHSRQMNLTIPRRTFFPTAQRDSRVLNQALQRNTLKQISTIINS